MSKYIIYGLVCPIAGCVRYVGKSCSGLTRPKEHKFSHRLKEKTYKNNWVRGLISKNLMYEIVVLTELNSSEELANAEKYWIKYLRSLDCPLTNLTDGGDGVPGYIPTAEHRAKIAKSMMGNKRGSLTRGKKRPNQSEELKIKHAKTMGTKPFRDNSGNVYESISDASRKLGIHRGSIYRVLSKKQLQTISGLKFSYVEDNKE